MDDYFQLPVKIDGKVVEFEARLLFHGYIHRVEVVVDAVSVLFEPDEERNNRALVSMEQLEGKGKLLQRSVLAAIADVLQTLPEQ
jgi:hypothetical protein